jgi:hypothetical protein
MQITTEMTETNVTKILQSNSHTRDFISIRMLQLRKEEIRKKNMA